MRYLHIATIETVGAFPIDMLRYDGCYPRQEWDSISIAASIATQESIIVEVMRETNTKESNWTVERWESFYCKITADETRKII